jgi:hypothetical protein
MRRENIMEIHACVSYNSGNMRGFGKFQQNINGELLKHAIDFE